MKLVRIPGLAGALSLAVSTIFFAHPALAGCEGLEVLPPRVDDRADAESSAPYLQAAAECGNARAAYILGVMTLEGFGVAKNNRLARVYLRQAADGGDVEAAHYYGVLLAKDAEFDAATDYLKIAAKADSLVAMHDLAFIQVWRADGSKRQSGGNYYLAQRMFREAAAAGHNPSRVGLARMYAMGGLPDTKGEARAILEQAVADGYAPARQLLAELDSRPTALDGLAALAATLHALGRFFEPETGSMTQSELQEWQDEQQRRNLQRQIDELSAVAWVSIGN